MGKLGKKINKYKTTLVASPRCGGHWMTMVIDLYFKNQNPNQFVFSQRKNHICKHTHDGKLDEKYNNVIYLYREVVDKIYSEMVYYHKNPEYRQGRHKMYYNTNINENYEDNRKIFKNTHKNFIYDILLTYNKNLKPFFNE